MKQQIYELLTKGSIISISALTAGITDVFTLFICLFSLVLIDNILAIIEVLTIKKEKFDYKKLKYTMQKTLTYTLLIGAGFLLYIISEVKFHIFFAIYAGIYEMFSILRHVSKATGLDLITVFLEFIKEKLSFKYFNNEKDTTDNEQETTDKEQETTNNQSPFTNHQATQPPSHTATHL